VHPRGEAAPGGSANPSSRVDNLRHVPHGICAQHPAPRMLDGLVVLASPRIDVGPLARMIEAEQRSAPGVADAPVRARSFCRSSFLMRSPYAESFSRTFIRNDSTFAWTALSSL